jgi:dihydrofolate reductase
VSNLVLQMSVSLDGYFEGPHGELDWHLVDEELHGHFNEVLGAMDAFIDGRVTYELMAGYWPTADADPDAPPTVAEFARIWREMPKLVYSRTLQHADWNSTIVREVDPQAIRELKERSRGDLAIGGAQLAAAFREHDLIDELRLYVVPVVLGAGRPLFPPGGPRLDLRPVETRTFGNGVVLLRYAR